jgi:hypothetical protein
MKIENQKICEFLRDLADKIDNDAIDDKSLDSVCQFYVGYKLNKEIDETPNATLDEKDLVKFLVLGWYIYRVILRDNSMSSISNV